MQGKEGRDSQQRGYSAYMATRARGRIYSRMFKRLARSPVIPFIGGTLIWAYMSILSHTMRWRVEGIENARKLWTGPEGWVLASWHSRILLMPVMQIIYRRKWAKPPQPTAMMVSTSRDGEFTNRTGRWLGLHIIRGSAATKKGKDRRGVAAAREAMEVMKKGGGIVITIDGPIGPPEVVGIGTIKLAQQMNAPILAYGISANAKRLGTWDRLLLPKPFARAAIVIPPPIPTSKDMDSEELRQRVERTLREATARADELAGLPQDLTPAAPRAAAPPTPSPAKSVEPVEAVIGHGGS
jgi:lysophospholipid acyltransferase (LPLAT)-like uncharacterized protein